jgi:hypothetical protein
MSYVIYCATNKINGMKYIGQTNNLEQRIRYHKSFSKNPRSNLFYQAIQEFGFNQFVFEVLKELKEDESPEEFERLFIKKMNTLNPNGYNSKRIYTRSKGAVHTNESKQKIRDEKLGEKNPMFGKHHNVSSKEKIRQGILNSSLCNSILMVDATTLIIIDEFKNRTEAESKTNILKGTIWSRLKNKLIVDNIIWVYKDNYQDLKKCNDYRNPKR